MTAEKSTKEQDLEITRRRLLESGEVRIRPDGELMPDEEKRALKELIRRSGEVKFPP
jgi:hypothetical protein